MANWKLDASHILREAFGVYIPWYIGAHGVRMVLQYAVDGGWWVVCAKWTRARAQIVI